MGSESQSLQLLPNAVQESPHSPDHGEVNSVPALCHSQVNFWCYLCSKVVSAEPERPGDNSEMVCSDCRSGFIEAMTAAQSLPDVRQAQHRRRRRGGRLSQSIESLESVYSQQLSQLFHLLGQSSRNTSVSDQGHRSDQEGDGGRIILQDELGSYPPLARSTSQRRAVSEIESEGYDHIESFLGESDTNITFSGQGTIIGESDTNITFSGHGANSDASGDVLGDSQSFVDGEMFLIQQDAESHVDGDSDSGLENMRAGPYEWDSIDSNDDGEWEQADEEDEDGIEGREGTGETRGASSAEESSEQTDWRPQLQLRRTRWRNLRRLQRRAMNVEFNLHQYLPGIFQNLGGNNLEASLELHDRPFYVGNPGDYLDARGFEQLLQHLAENDNSRRGAPPAAQSAVENLPLVVIKQEHVEDGSSVCAICKDAVALGDQAKQLPCMHLYHSDCIFPWLRARNSCPVCRYELPTDDPDYEEEKRNATGRTNHNYNEQNTSQESLSELSAYTDELENAPVEQHLDAENVLESSRMVGNPGVLDFDEEIDTEGNMYGDLEQEYGAECANERETDYEFRDGVAESNRGGDSRTSGRGWFFLAAGPVLSVVGLVLVLCFGNRLIGSRIQQNNRQSDQQQHHMQHVGVRNEVNRRRRWWSPF
eukprot:Gb_29787 [translate_table: standard]